MKTNSRENKIEMKICEICGLPKDLCVCEEIAREVQKVKVYTVRRRFGKLMTIVEGIDEHDIDIRELTKTLNPNVPVEVLPKRSN